jgi:hypothetical protein
MKTSLLFAALIALLAMISQIACADSNVAAQDKASAAKKKTKKKKKMDPEVDDDKVDGRESIKPVEALRHFMGFLMVQQSIREGQQSFTSCLKEEEEEYIAEFFEIIIKSCWRILDEDLAQNWYEEVYRIVKTFYQRLPWKINYCIGHSYEGARIYRDLGFNDKGADWFYTFFKDYMDDNWVRVKDNCRIFQQYTLGPHWDFDRLGIEAGRIYGRLMEFRQTYDK